MDVTALFKACVKTLRTRNKALGIEDKDKDKFIFPKGNKVKSDFAIKAKEVVGTITKMKDFLLEHRKDYITMNHILHGIPTMTDSERDKIDSDAQAFMQMCVEVIKTLRQEVKKTISAQLKEHQEAIITLIDQYLKAVCKIYSGQKAIRVKQAVDRQKIEIEGKVVEIGRLQEILSEKVLQQDQDINRISDTVMGTTENIKEGNEELREAMKKNAGFRVWILFFLIVLSFSLLFLDWYSP
ncbi:syntaxin-18 [Trichonephila inaurata madagascariensis]|uniref:Syntaxin-18 n=1 Tax=Trichonephila inaurata madagascariensis TaxID=2747483 RepID=A0A8X7CAC8_9ARAC|nr:syntaxin-18 [Trichonephila inaurata madagascariensis]